MMDDNRSLNFEISGKELVKNDTDVEHNDTGPNTAILVAYGVICAVGLAGNLLVCTVLLRVKSLRSNTSDFLVHLSLVDLLVCLLVVPFKIIIPLYSPLTPNPSFWGEFRCRLFLSEYPFWVCALTSVYSLFSVSLERFLAIVHPHRYKHIFAVRRKKLLIIATCWILAALAKSFIMFPFHEDPELGCRYRGWPTKVIQAVLGVFNFTLNLFAPFVLMVAMQWKVINTLRSQEKKLNRLPGSYNLNHPAYHRKMWQLQARQTLVRTLLVFGLTFAICWFPDQFMFLLYSLGAELSFTTHLYNFGVILAVGNSCVNPIIYTLTNKQFRRGIGTAFGTHRSAWVGNGSTASSATLAVITLGTESRAK